MTAKNKWQAFDSRQHLSLSLRAKPKFTKNVETQNKISKSAFFLHCLIRPPLSSTWRNGRTHEFKSVKSIPLTIALLSGDITLSCFCTLHDKFFWRRIVYDDYYYLKIVYWLSQRFCHVTPEFFFKTLHLEQHDRGPGYISFSCGFGGWS